MKKSLLVTVLSLPLVFSLFALTTAQAQPPDQKSLARIYKEVRHELVMLPYYGVFDNLAYKVDADGTVTLLGQVSPLRGPTLKSDAENAVKQIEGVTKVVNDIEVLPHLPMDDASAAPNTAPSTANACSTSINCALFLPFTSS